MYAPHQLCSVRHRKMQRLLHADPEGFGQRGGKWADVVMEIAKQYGAYSILDYGCGQGSLKRALIKRSLGAIRVDEYDPGIKGKDGLPIFADLVVCTDVLEHIEPDKLDAVLDHIRMLARKAVWVVVATKDTAKTLADGRSAHLIVQPGKWWIKRLRKVGFTVCPPPASARDCHKKEWIAVLEP